MAGSEARDPCLDADADADAVRGLSRAPRPDDAWGCDAAARGLGPDPVPDAAADRGRAPRELRQPPQEPTLLRALRALCACTGGRELCGAVSASRCVSRCTPHTPRRAARARSRASWCLCLYRTACGGGLRKG